MDRELNGARKLKILLVAHSFPPAPVVGSFRAAKVAEAFRRAGHEVRVVTGRLPDEREAVRKDVPGLRVDTVTSLPGPAELYGSLKEWGPRKVTTGSTAAPGTRSLTPRPKGSGPRWKRYLLSALWVPDRHKGFIAPVIAHSLPLLREGVDLVYTTAPPFSDHLVGLALKRMTGVRWVAEFRDPWTDNRKAARLRSAGADRVNRWLERRCLEEADQVVSVAEGIHELLSAKMPPDERDRFLLALNGIDNLAPSPPTQRGDGPFRIVHIGSFYGGRDPRPFLHALSAVAKERGLGPADVRVEFIGRSRRYRGISLEAIAAELGLADLVEFHDWMPQEQARERSNTADLLLLPFPHAHIIPNKLYDYLGARKPILAFVHPRGEAARMLNRIGGHYLVTPDDPASVHSALEAALGSRSAPPASESHEAILREWTTETQMRRLLAGLGMEPVEQTDGSEAVSAAT